MLDGIKRWLGRPRDARDFTSPFERWSRASSVQVRAARENEGVIIEGQAGTTPWRLEWGPSQRPYVIGQELRIRAEPALPRELHAIVLNRSLQDAIEKAMFEEFVGGVQTRIDTETPPEMRWVVMYPKLSKAELGAAHEGFAAASNANAWLQQWLGSPLGAALAALPAADAPFVLMVGRGKLTLRTAVEEAKPSTVEPHLRVFETALREAARVPPPGAAG